MKHNGRTVAQSTDLGTTVLAVWLTQKCSKPKNMRIYRHAPHMTICTVNTILFFLAYREQWPIASIRGRANVRRDGPRSILREFGL